MLIYIHIPFCDSKCGYCAFNSLTNMVEFKKEYLNALKNDIKYSLQNIETLDSIFFGGGTPNTLNPKDYEEIFIFLEPYINRNTEITMELNPNRDLSLIHI